MASKKKKAAAAAGSAVATAKQAKKAKAKAEQARNNPYVRAITEDDDLRDSVTEAYESAKSAYDRLSSKRNKDVKSVLADPKLQADLKRAVDAIRDAGETLTDAPKSKKKVKSSGGGGLGRKLLLGVVAGGLALALSEGLRKKVLDALFGAEEEFEYTSTTAPAPPAPAPAPAS